MLWKTAEGPVYDRNNAANIRPHIHSWLINPADQLLGRLQQEVTSQPVVVAGSDELSVTAATEKQQVDLSDGVCADSPIDPVLFR